MTASAMWTFSVPWWELVLRAAVVYVFLIVLLRLTGKRQVGQLAPFDLVLLLVLSNAVQNSMNAGDNSLVGGLVSAGTLVVLNFAVGWATFRSKRLERVLEGHPVLLVHEGKLYPAALAATQMTRQELDAAIRLAGCARIDEVRVAVLENTGRVSVIPKKPPTKGQAEKTDKPDEVEEVET